MSFGFSDTQRFQIVRKLGEGGMGVVYEAFDCERQTRVALKTLRTWSGNLLLRFKREFREFQHINHPNLVSLGELFEERDQWFFTMELIDGVEWFKHVGRGPDLNEQRLRRTLWQIIEGLSTLHREGKVHRDIKPSNVLVTHDERAVLIDFGLATEVDPESKLTSTSIIGTPAYMAPEQLEGGRVGPEADWYSMGIMLYETLTGRLPFEGPAARMSERKLRGEYAPLEALVPKLAPDLREVCTRLLSPKERNRISERELRCILRGHGPSPERIDLPFQEMEEWITPFVGRHAELERLHAALTSTVETGRGHAVVIYGESGIGKSATVEQWLKEVHARFPDAIVLTGRCYERESM